jgi:hypothetical protein
MGSEQVFALGPGLRRGFLKLKINTNIFFLRSFSVIAARPLKNANLAVKC